MNEITRTPDQRKELIRSGLYYNNVRTPLLAFVVGVLFSIVILTTLLICI